jgi:uncharacterized protein
MLRVDLRELRQGPVETVGVIPARDDLFQGLDLDLAEPLQVTGVLESTGHGNYFWRGRFAGFLATTCRRCLRELRLPVASAVEVLFSTDRDLQDDIGVYQLPEPANQVDVTLAVREELAFAVPSFPLCRDDCRGLCVRCGSDLNQGPCGCGPTTS